MAKRKKTLGAALRIKARKLICKGWHVTLLRRDPTEAGGCEVGEDVRIVEINHATKTITVMPGSPPLHSEKDVFDPHE